MPRPGDRRIWQLQTTMNEKFDLEKFGGGGAASFDFRTTALLLTISLEAAVPLHYLELDRLKESLSEDDFWDHIQAEAKAAADLVAEKGDLLMFRGKKAGQTAEVFSALALGVACLAFAPGGVMVFGVRFERKAVWIRKDPTLPTGADRSG